MLHLCRYVQPENYGLGDGEYFLIDPFIIIRFIRINAFFNVFEIKLLFNVSLNTWKNYNFSCCKKTKVLNILSGIEILTSIRDHNSVTNKQNMTGYKPILDPVNINVSKTDLHTGWVQLEQTCLLIQCNSTQHFS